MDFKKKIRSFALLLLALGIAFLFFMHYLKFDNMLFLFCILASFLYASMAIYSLIHRNEVMDYLLDYYKGDSKKANEYYRYQLFFIKVYFVVAAILLFIGVWALLKGGFN